MIGQVNLPLRSIHATDSIPWWPLAPGWWGVIALLLAAVLLALWWRRKERERVARVHAFFDRELQGAANEAERVGRISELLRRASRRHVKDSDQLSGAAWLDALNKGLKNKPFHGQTGELMLDGGFRRDVDANDYAVLERAARDRFVKWVRDV